MDKNIKEQNHVEFIDNNDFHTQGKELRLCLKFQRLKRPSRITGRIRRCLTWCRLWWWRQRRW